MLDAPHPASFNPLALRFYGQVRLGMRRMVDWGLVIAAGTAGMVTALLLGQVALVQIYDARLREYASSLLNYAVDVAQESRSTLETVRTSQLVVCSDEDLHNLRFLAFRTDHLRDVGRVEDGRIACTALWGRLPAPVPLPAYDRLQADGDRLWANVENIGAYGTKVDMVVRGSAIVFTSPIAFQRYEQPAEEMSALVLTRDAAHVYRHFGDTAPLLGRSKAAAAGWSSLAPQRIVSRCSGEVDICVIAGVRGANILSHALLPLLAVGGLGALTGASLGWGWLMRRDAHLSLPRRIRRAVDEGRLRVVYQPVVRMRDRRMVGVEALARLTDEAGEPIPPPVFIAAAEEIGLTGEIARLVIRQALTGMREHLSAAREFHVSINLAVQDILDPALLGYLDAEVARLGLSPRKVTLEITERSTADQDRLVAAMERFLASGYRFFIDDFGTGYSNLEYLARLPIEGIKVDRMFTEAIGREAVCSAIVDNVCAISAKLGLALVIEGVETDGQAAYILALRPDALGQGWLYGQPAATVELPPANA